MRDVSSLIEEMISTQDRVNLRAWSEDDTVPEYANRVLRPAEVVVLVRYARELSGRVLEGGCGAGRVLGYLAELGGEVHGVDISPAMVEYCRRTYPLASVELGDLGALRDSVSGPYDVVIVPDNTLDIFDHSKRLQVLSDIRSLLSPAGLLIFSSHNLDHADGRLEATRSRLGASFGRSGLSRLVAMSPRQAASVVRRAPRMIRNRRALRPLQTRGEDHAILNDSERDWGALHYYVGRDAQERQLRELGFELVECLDADGRPVPAGAIGYGPWLHYVARAPATASS